MEYFYLFIWDPNLPLRNPKYPYVDWRKYDIYDIEFVTGF